MLELPALQRHMGEATTRATRRQLRRAVGDQALEVITAHDHNLEFLRRELLKHTERLDAADRDVFALHEKLKTAELRDLARPNPQTFRERLRWLWGGK